MSTNLNKRRLIGIDVGGSHICAAFVANDLSGIDPESHKRNEVNSRGSAEEIIEAWLHPILQLREKAGEMPIRLGVAMPGPFDYEKGISLIQGLDKYESIYQFNIRNILSSRLDISPSDIFFRNDAEAFVHGEVMSSPELRSKRVAGITLGTGLGSAISEKGITTDLNYAQIPFKSGIAEEYISTRWFVQECNHRAGMNVNGVRELLNCGESNLVRDIFAEFSANLSEFLNYLIRIQQPDVIVIGGNIARSWEYFIDEVEASLINTEVSLIQSKLWEKAALIGAFDVREVI